VTERPSSLTIPITAGVGRGSTCLSSFDAALAAAGVSNFNLVRLSSVIPTGGRAVVTTPDQQLRGGWGDRLYCVYAAQTATAPDEQAWAGIGWITTTDGSGRGVFVEHEAHSETEVRRLISASLADLAAVRREPFSAPQMHVTGVTCAHEPVTALVVASYETAGWGEK
jgi:arginine decarboxylase